MGMLAVMKKNAVILRKPSATIAIRVDLTAEQRKFYDALLYVVRTELQRERDTKKTKFSVNLAEIKNFFGIKDKKNKYYISSLEGLVSKIAEYNILKKDKTIKGKFALVAWAESIENKTTKEVIFNFQIPDVVLESMLKDEQIYANIDLIVLRGLRSKYAVILYELVKDYVKRNSEIPEMSMEKFRGLFGVETKYKAIKDLRKYVLDVATKEMNENDKFDFLVSYDLRRVGKRYKYIKFNVKPKPAELKLTQQANKVIEKEIAENKDLQELLLAVPEDYRKRKNCISLLSGALKKKDKNYIQAQIEYTNDKNPKNYNGYLKQAIEKDYAGAEIIEDFEIEEQDWKKKITGKIVVNSKTEERYKIAYVGEQDEEGYYEVRLDKLDKDDNTNTINWFRWTEEKLKKLAGVEDE